MSTTITLVVVVAFSFVIGAFIRRLATRRGILLSGAEYLIVGVLVGPLVSGVVDAQSLLVIEPIMWLLIGLIGFQMGLPLRHAVRAGGVVGTAAATLLSVMSMGAVGGAGLLALRFLQPQTASVDLILPLVVFATAGSVVSARFIGLATKRFSAEGPLTRFLQTSAEWGSTLAVVIAGGVMDWYRSDAPMELMEMSLPGELWTVASVAIGLLCGLLFWLFHRNEDDDERTFLATVGVIIFASGIAAAVGASPLLVGLLSGVTVSILSPQADDLSEKLEAIDYPAGIVLMIFAGALWQPPTLVGSALVVVYLVSRLAAFWLLPRLFVRPILHGGTVGWIGRGMRGQGVLPVSIVLSMVLVSVFVLEIGAGSALRRLLGDAGELGVVAPVPMERSGATA